jgi:tetratricopeptide (TPR) repeat protein
LAILLTPAAASGQIGQRILNRIIGPQDEQPTTPQAPSWVGKRVMTARPGVYSRHSDEFGRQVRDADLTDLVYTVLNQEGEFVWIRHRNIESWVPRTDVVLLDEAVSFFSERIRRDPNDSYAFALRGRAWREEDELERALKDLNTALRLDPKNATWLANRGMVHDELDESSRALDDYDDAIKLEPREAQHYLGRALVHKHDKDFDDAIDDYTSALRLEPKSVDAYYNRGNAYKAKRDYEEAIRDYTEAMKALDSPRYERDEGDEARDRLKLFKDRKAYREE